MNDPATQKPEEEETDLEMAIDAATGPIISVALEHYLQRQGPGCDYSEYAEPCELCGAVSDLEKLIGHAKLKGLALIYYQDRSQLAELEDLRKIS